MQNMIELLKRERSKNIYSNTSYHALLNNRRKGDYINDNAD